MVLQRPCISEEGFQPIIQLVSQCALNALPIKASCSPLFPAGIGCRMSFDI